MKVIRQGDVLLRQIAAVPAVATQEKGPCILAYGEATGHSHQVKTGGEIWVDVNENGRRYLKVLEDTTLDHEEHSCAVLAKGDVYEIVIQRSYTPQGIRNVQD